jgi:6-phosphogluconolactonase
MRPAVNRDVRVHPDGDAMSREVARAVVGAVEETLARAEHFSLVLAGGQTPRGLYRTLATVYRETIPWARLHLFWGDERYVPWDDPRSNYRLVRESLLDHVPIPKENVFPMPTDLPDPEAAAAVYEQTLRARFPSSWPRFDLILLGMGPDGHTASLFPRSPILAEQVRWVAAARAPVEPALRVTLTRPVLTHARRVFFLVTGSEKAEVLRRVLGGQADPAVYPAASVRPIDGDLMWWVDAQAARLLSDSGEAR